MDLTAALRAFIRIVERGSMTAAARDIGISQPAVSKLVRNLEEHAGARLLERTSRAMRPTALGLHLYEASVGALTAIDAAIESVRKEGGTVGGALHLHGPVCLGERRLHRIVMDFQEQYPGVPIHLTLENQPVDLVRENIDLAIRMGRPTDQNLILRRIGSVKRILVASPEYLSRRGPVHDRLALCDHDVLVTDTVLSRNGTLMLCHEGRMEETSVRPILTTNNAQVLVDAMKAGRGVGTAQLQLVADELADGRLVRVLGDYEIKPTELYLTYPSSKFLRPTVRAFIDFAVLALRRIEGIA